MTNKPVAGVPRAMIRHLDLPLVDQREVEGALGFAKLAGLVASLPLTILGVTVVVAGLVFNWPVLALMAGTVTLAILVALHEDTRLPKALDMLARGDVERAERALEQVAGSSRRTRDQRQSARAHLASICWQRGDLSTALYWTRARRLDGEDRRGTAPDERFLSAVSEVQLLSLCGELELARGSLARLPPLPPGPFFELMACTTELLLHFARHDPDAVTRDLESSEALARRSDGVGTTLLLLAWAFHGRGEEDRARSLLELAAQQGDLAYLERHYPGLWHWAGEYRGRLHYARG